ncbi:MAG: hypothetical protein AAFZ65_04260 [Planctomycetota bacterium]
MNRSTLFVLACFVAAALLGFVVLGGGRSSGPAGEAGPATSLLEPSGGLPQVPLMEPLPAMDSLPAMDLLPEMPPMRAAVRPLELRLMRLTADGPVPLDRPATVWWSEAADVEDGDELRIRAALRARIVAGDPGVQGVDSRFGEGVRLPLPSGRVAVLARDEDGRVAASLLESSEAGQATLVLGYELDAVAEVRDGAGEPVEGAVVRLLVQAPAGNTAGGGRSTTDRAGRAWIDLPTQVERPTGEYGLSQVGASEFLPLEPFDPLAPLTPVRLTVDPAAGVEVRVRGAGGTQVALVSEQVFDQSFADLGRAIQLAGERRPLVGGAARFQAAAPSSRMVVAVTDAHGETVGLERVSTGAPGSITRVVVELESGAIVFRGRVDGLDLEESPGPTWILFDPASEAYRPQIGERMSVASDGEFRIRVKPEAAAALTPQTLLIVARQRTGLCAFDLSTRLSPGEYDLGSVDFGSTACAGVFVQPDGAPAKGVNVGIDMRPKGGADWIDIGLFLVVRSDVSGRFAVAGTLTDRCEWRVVPRWSDWLLEGDSRFISGAERVRLEVHREPSYLGQLLFNDEVLESGRVMNGFRITTRRSGGEPVLGQLGPDGAFGVKVPPGSTASVDVRLVWTGEVVASVAGLEPPAGPDVRDPRLEFDLRERVRLVRVRVSDAAGAPIETATVGRPLQAHARLAPAGGEHALLFSSPAMDLEVSAPGYLSATLSEVEQDIEVALEPSAPITLLWPGMVETDAECRLRPVLMPLGSEGVGIPDREAAFDTDGVAIVTAPRAGDFVLRLLIETVHEGRRTTRFFEDHAPPRVSIDDPTVPQSFEVSFDAQALVQALEELAE